MNKFKIANIIVAVFAITLIILAFASAKPKTIDETQTVEPVVKTRIIEATVEGINVDGTNVLFRGNDGNLWSANINTTMYRGQQVIIELSNNGTVTFKDDEILNVWLT